MPLALEGAGTVLTTEYIVVEQDAPAWQPKRGGQLRDIDQLTVPALASVKEDDVSVMQEDEEDVCVWCPYYCRLEAQLDSTMQVEHNPAVRLLLV